MPPIKSSSSSSSSKYSSKHFHPYFTPSEVNFLSEKQRGRQTANQEEKTRQNACTFLETIGLRVGFPRRTIATAQLLYHRFHLFYHRKDFQYHDVALAAIFVSAKMHDTLKKPRELQSIAYGIRFPDLAAKSKQPGGEVDLDTMDAAIVEADRQRLLAVERLILETVCFNFNARMAFPYVIKLGKELKASKKLIQFAWRIAIDMHRTLVPLIYPPHAVALGSLYTASLLLSFEQPPSPHREGQISSVDLASQLNKHLDWEKRYRTKSEDLDDIAHTFIDLLTHFTQNSSSSSTSTSPSTPSSPSPHLSARAGGAHGQHLQHQYQYNADQLMRLKIAMRETEHPPRKWKARDGVDLSATYTSGNVGGGEKAGQNEGTVRFLFFPPGSEGASTM